jgi:hypothetical protein
MMRAVVGYLLICIVGLLFAYTLVGIARGTEAAVDEPMPPVATLILCKSEPDGPPDMNAEWTHVRKRKWVYEDSMMVCRLHPVELSWLPALKLTPETCQKSAIMEMARWEIENPTSEYQPWRVACHAPIMDLRTGRIIGWKAPDCGHRDTVKCEGDSAI